MAWWCKDNFFDARDGSKKAPSPSCYSGSSQCMGSGPVWRSFFPIYSSLVMEQVSEKDRCSQGSPGSRSQGRNERCQRVSVVLTSFYVQR